MIVESIIDLARKLKMKTLAEGVETEEQAQTLRNLGCTVCQGFLYARPLPAEEFVRYAKQAGTADRTMCKSGVLA